MRPDMIGPRKLRPAGSFGEPLFQMTQEDSHRVLKGVVEPMITRGQVNGVMPGAHAAPKPQPSLWVMEKAKPEAQMGRISGGPSSGEYTFIKKPDEPHPDPGEFSGEEGSSQHRQHLINQYKHAITHGNYEMADQASMDHESHFGSQLAPQGSGPHRMWQEQRHEQTPGGMFRPKMRHGEGGVTEPPLKVRGQRYLGQTGKETGGSGSFHVEHAAPDWGHSTYTVRSPEHFKQTLGSLERRGGYEIPKAKPKVEEAGKAYENAGPAKVGEGEWHDPGREIVRKAEMIPGGLAEGKPDSDFDPEQLMEGMKVEMEHSGDPKKAREIAKDHLSEDKNYYKKLAKMEAKKAIQGQQTISEPISPRDPMAGTHFPKIGGGDDLHVETAKHEIQADHFSRQKGGALRSQFHARSAAKLRALGGSPTVEHRKQAFRELPPHMSQLMRSLMSKAIEVQTRR